MRQTRYFIAATSHKHPDTWARCKELKSWGATVKLKAISVADAGDRILVWLGRKGFAATATVTGPQRPPTSGEGDWPHGKAYPFRLPLEPDVDYGKPFLVPWKAGRDEATGLTAASLIFGFTEIAKDQFDHYVAQLEAANAAGAGADSENLTAQELESADVEPDTAIAAKQETAHNLAQLRLLQIGKATTGAVHAATSDKSRIVSGVAFDSLALPDLTTPGLSNEAKRVVTNIDVLWLKDDEVVAAFEIESTTSIYSGLLRLSDLVTTHPYAKIALYVVANESQKADVCRQLRRPTFKKLGMPAQTKFLPIERLGEALEQAQKLPGYLLHTFIDSYSSDCG